MFRRESLFVWSYRQWNEQKIDLYIYIFMIVIHRHLEDKHSSISSTFFHLHWLHLIRYTDIWIKNNHVYQYRFRLSIDINRSIRITALQRYIRNKSVYVDSYYISFFATHLPMLYKKIYIRKKEIDDNYYLMFSQSNVRKKEKNLSLAKIVS